MEINKFMTGEYRKLILFPCAEILLAAFLQAYIPSGTELMEKCAAAATAPTTLPVVEDVCGNTLTAPTPVVGGTYTDCEGTKTYTYTYKDCADLEYEWTYTYT